jgi:CheY-like chemotaxis protein
MAPLRQIKMISIVDDDSFVRDAIKSILRSAGYIAVTFASAEEFLQSEQLDATSCLISDVQMPGLSGVELQNSVAIAGLPDADDFRNCVRGREDPRASSDVGGDGFLNQALRRGMLDRICA